MGFQDATSGGGLGFDSPWMSPKDRGEEPEVPLEVKMAAPRQSLVGASWGRQMSNQPTSQGGGAIIGGGIGGGPVLGNSWYPSNHRGMIGGPGTRTGGYG